MDNPKASIAFCASFVGLTIRVKMFLKAVPAMLAFTPLEAIKPVAIATSSIVKSKAPATEPAYLNVAPIFATLVLLFIAAAAITSAIRAASSAVILKAVRLSVTISDTMAKSSPDAVARFSTGSMPANICSVFQPAIPMYCIASATSEAE